MTINMQAKPMMPKQEVLHGSQLAEIKVSGVHLEIICQLNLYWPIVSLN